MTRADARAHGSGVKGRPAPAAWVVPAFLAAPASVASFSSSAFAKNNCPTCDAQHSEGLVGGTGTDGGEHFPSGLQFLGGAPIAPALSSVHRHGPQEDDRDHHKAAYDNPIEVAREKIHGRILARWDYRA
jgi:hypothetical protein